MAVWVNDEGGFLVMEEFKNEFGICSKIIHVFSASIVSFEASAAFSISTLAYKAIFSKELSSTLFKIAFAIA